MCVKTNRAVERSTDFLSFFASCLEFDALLQPHQVLIFGVNIVSTLPYLIVVGIRYRHNEQIDQTALSRAKKVPI